MPVAEWSCGPGRRRPRSTVSCRTEAALWAENDIKNLESTRGHMTAECVDRKLAGSPP
jgi:hypothetical protein